MSVPPLLARIRTLRQLRKFDWNTLDNNFVVKPASGYGGEGILIVRRKGKTQDSYIKMDRKKIAKDEVALHARDILLGKYSLHDHGDSVLIEERIKIHPKFFTYTRSGTPDVRVILYNKIPVMAMLRVPTEDSAGRANLEQGAMGLGIDMASGITTFGVRGKDTIIETMYNFRTKQWVSVSGKRIPEWKNILETAVKCAFALPGLSFLGVDVVLDKERGPVVLEVNARPGLSIQLCNKAGLKSRMEKVEDISVTGVPHAVNLGRYLFGEKMDELSSKNKEVLVVKPIERVKIMTGKKIKSWVAIRAKVDTGAYRSSIDYDLAEKLGLLAPEKILYYRHFKSALGRNIDRPVVGVTFVLAGKKVHSQMSVAGRNKLKTKMLIGRRDLRGFVVKLKGPKTSMANASSKLTKRNGGKNE